MEYPGWGPGSLSIQVHTFFNVLWCWHNIKKLRHFFSFLFPLFYFMRLGKSRTNFFFTLGAEIGVIRSFLILFVMTLLGYFLSNHASFIQPRVRFTFFLRSIRFGLAFSWFSCVSPST